MSLLQQLLLLSRHCGQRLGRMEQLLLNPRYLSPLGQKPPLHNQPLLTPWLWEHGYVPKFFISPSFRLHGSLPLLPCHLSSLSHLERLIAREEE